MRQHFFGYDFMCLLRNSTSKMNHSSCLAVRVSARRQGSLHITQVNNYKIL